MNADRRKRLAKAADLLEGVKDALAEAQELIEIVGEEERESFDNLSEGLQAAERGERMDEVATLLEEKSEELGNAVEAVENAINACNDAQE